MAEPLRVVMIYPTAPKEILSVLADYLHQTADGISYVHGNSVEVGIQFVGISLVKQRGDPDPWFVQIPVSCVLAILDMSKKAQRPRFPSVSPRSTLPLI